MRLPPGISPQGDQRRAQDRSADEIGRPTVAEYGVITVLALGHQRVAVAALGQQAEALPEVPAVRALAEATHMEQALGSTDPWAIAIEPE